MPITIDVQDPVAGEPVVLQINSAKVKRSKKATGVIYLSLFGTIVSGSGVGYTVNETLCYIHPKKPTQNAPWQRRLAETLQAILGHTEIVMPADPEEFAVNPGTVSELPGKAVLVTLKWEDNEEYPEYSGFKVSRWLNPVSPDQISTSGRFDDDGDFVV